MVVPLNIGKKLSLEMDLVQTTRFLNQRTIMMIFFLFQLQGTSQVTGIPFSVGENGTVALCELSFSTDLEQIYSASVLYNILWLFGNSYLGFLSDFL